MRKTVAFVVVLDSSPGTKATLGSNAAHVTVRYDARTGTVLALGALDNLVKGASGQAVQCANILLGLPEPTGLTSLWIAPWPMSWPTAVCGPCETMKSSAVLPCAANARSTCCLINSQVSSWPSTA